MTPHEILKDRFGFESFRSRQEEIIQNIVTGNSVLVVMPTGSGKSLCYQIPAICRGGLTIVISPLVALMQDQVSALKLAGIAADTINSSRERRQNVDVWRQVSDGAINLLYLSPERLMTDRMLAAVAKLPLRQLVIDEAHCVSRWGRAFRPEYEDLGRLKTLFPDVPVAAFTATADETTRRDICEKLLPEKSKEFVTGFDRPNIQLAVEPKRSWKNQLTGFLENHTGESGIVYCLSRKKTEEVADILQSSGHRALIYHAGMDNSVRIENQNLFVSEQGVVMVATIAFGMGIDKADVRFIFHTDLPDSLEAYYQEIGRAGRDGAPAEAHMLYGLDDIRMRRMFIEEEDSDADRKRREHKRLDALIAYCETPSCRRRTLLAYFGEETGACNNCDVCLNPVQLQDGSVEGQKALSAIVRTGQRFGAAHIIDILRGQSTEKVSRLGHDRLPTFGVGSEHNKDLWRSILRQLVATGLLELDIKGYGGLKLTSSGHALLKGDQSFQYRTDILKPAGSKSQAAKAKTAEEQSLTDSEHDLFDRLKALRLDLAREREVPAFVIFSDRTLKNMAQLRPTTKDEFEQVHGVGQAKLAEFADVFLRAINSDQPNA